MHTSSALRVAHRRSGFTLIEIIVVITILSILAGAAVPVAAKAINSAARKRTSEELALFSDAAIEYFRDTNSVPLAIADLEVDPKRKTLVGWAGPYVAGAVKYASGTSAYTSDAWSRNYKVVSGTTLRITSAAEDAVFGTSDDIQITVDFTPVQRDKTLASLLVINQAVVLYNGVYQKTKPLPAVWSQALALLVARGYLPSGTTYQKDAWGKDFTADPAGKAPLVKVRSVSITG